MKENKQITDHDSYLAAQTPEARKVLKSLRKLISNAIPDAEEVISYQMPAYRLNGMVCYYAAFKEHFSLFIPPTYQIPFQKELKAFDCSKSGIRIPYGDPIPEKLFISMVQFAAETVRNKSVKKKSTAASKKAAVKSTTKQVKTANKKSAPVKSKSRTSKG